MPYLLPDTLATGLTCVKISIPDTPQDIKNFLGTVLDLCYWYNYERTGDDKGKQNADIWREAFNEIRIGACMLVQQKTGEPCILEVSYDDGETWEDFADITLCVNADYIQSLIDNNTNLQQAIAQYAGGASAGIYDTEIPANLSKSFKDGQSGCNNDNLYGMCLQLTKLLNTVSENLLDIFVAGLQQAGNLGDLIEAIPLVGELPADDILQFLEKVATQVNSAYQAAYDTQLEEDISCEFFCAAQGTCDLTFEQARDIIKSHIANPVSAQDFYSMINDMIANNWFGDQAVWVFFYFILETIIFGGEILGQDVNRFAKTVATYFNDPNSDWSTLCTSCGWTYTCNFTNANCGWTAFENTPPYDDAQGQWISGQGWKPTDFEQFSGLYNRSVGPEISFTNSIVNTIVFTFDFEIGTWVAASDVTTAIFGYKNGTLTESLIRNRQQQPDGTDLTFGEYNLGWDVDTIRLIVRPSTANSLGSLSGDAAIKSIIIQGEGTYPF